MDILSRKIRRALLLLFCVAILPLLILEGLLRCDLNGLPHMLKISIVPKHLFLPDTLLGWHPQPNTYRCYINNSPMLFSAKVNKYGNRITDEDTSEENRTKYPKISIYGCSCTFGVSVADSATQCYKLQKLLPNYCIENKGVPGYGLAQMFLSLQKSVMMGDTPFVAVFNYGEYQDHRVPQSKMWASTIYYCVDQSESKVYDELKFPYYTFDTSGIQLHRTPFRELTHLWPLADKLQSLFFINMFCYYCSDYGKKELFHNGANMTAMEIMKYCQAHKITPILAFLPQKEKDCKYAKELMENVKDKGYNILDYGIYFGDQGYNCGPYDTGHPNVRAHTIYAIKLYDFLSNGNLIVK